MVKAYFFKWRNDFLNYKMLKYKIFCYLKKTFVGL